MPSACQMCIRDRLDSTVELAGVDVFNSGVGAVNADDDDFVATVAEVVADFVQSSDDADGHVVVVAEDNFNVLNAEGSDLRGHHFLCLGGIPVRCV